MHQLGFFDLSDHLKRLSAAGDPLEEMTRVIDFEAFRPVLDEALAYSDGTKGGRPPYDPVAMFKVLILAAQHTVSDARMEFLIRDRLSWLRFLGFELGKPTPDENTIRLFRERLTEAGAIRRLFEAFDRQLRQAGYLAMGGQIIDASLVSAPKQRNTQDEKEAIKAGKTASEIWPDELAKAAQKDVDARWTVKIGRPKDKDAARSVPELAIAVFGYKSHMGIERRFGFIRTFAVTDAACHDGKNCAIWSRPTIPPRMCGPTPLTDPRPTRPGWPPGDGSRAFITRNQGANPWPSGPARRMPRSPPSAPGSSMFSPIRRTAWDCSSGPSDRPAPRPRSASPTWPTISSVSCSTKDGRRQDNCVHNRRKPTSNPNRRRNQARSPPPLPQNARHRFTPPKIAG